MKKLIIAIVAIAMTLSTLSLFGCGGNGSGASEVKTNEVKSVAMLMGVELSTTDSYVEKSLTATIYPADATIKEVEFSVSWQDGATLSGEDVSDYVQVIPESEGSASAKVRCYKAFGSDKIIITVTTRDGAKTDTCTVSFVGLASSLDIVSDVEVDNDIYSVYVDEEYSFGIELDNIFHEVNSDIEISVRAVGDLYFTKYRLAEDSEIEEMGVSSAFATYGAFGKTEKVHLNDRLSDYLEYAKIEDGQVKIKFKHTPFSTGYLSTKEKHVETFHYTGRLVFEEDIECQYYEQLTSYQIPSIPGASGYDILEDLFYEAMDFNEEKLFSKSVYFSVTVKDKLSNLSKSFNLFPLIRVGDVTLSSSSIIF